MKNLVAKLYLTSVAIECDVACTLCLIIPGILEDGGDDFGTSEDLFDAIGMLLQQADDSKTEDEIKIICSCLHSSMNL